MIENSELPYWLAMSQIPHVGPKRFFQMVEKIKTEELTLKEWWRLPERKLQTFGLSDQVFEALLEHRRKTDPEKLLDDIEKKEIRITTFDSENYPQLLKEIPDPPPVLFYRGEPRWNSLPLLAVVGTRKITGYGKLVTQRLTRDLVYRCYGIVSGFMYGVDATAHRSALDNDGYTVGVLGFGFDHMYPPEHRKLSELLLEKGGALLTEFLPAQPPIPGYFPLRNRIVAGMCLGVVVTEAAVESGSKITAQFAGEYGREVFAVPGAITSKFSDGTKDLVNNGAKLVTNVEDILAEFSHHTASSKVNSFTQILESISDLTDRKIVELLLLDTITIDDLRVELDMEIVDLMSRLSMLELSGVVAIEEGNYRVVG